LSIQDSGPQSSNLQTELNSKTRVRSLHSTVNFKLQWSSILTGDFQPLEEKKTFKLIEMNVTKLIPSPRNCVTYQISLKLHKQLHLPDTKEVIHREHFIGTKVHTRPTPSPSVTTFYIYNNAFWDLISIQNRKSQNQLFTSRQK
jgi:hypothetical protein